MYNSTIQTPGGSASSFAIQYYNIPDYTNKLQTFSPWDGITITMPTISIDNINTDGNATTASNYQWLGLAQSMIISNPDNVSAQFRIPVIIAYKASSRTGMGSERYFATSETPTDAIFSLEGGSISLVNYSSFKKYNNIAQFSVMYDISNISLVRVIE